MKGTTSVAGGGGGGHVTRAASGIALTTSHGLDKFTIKPQELQELIKQKDVVGIEKRGGVVGLAEALKTNLTTGLCLSLSEDLAARAEHFGRNVYEVPKPKSIFQFFFEALQDTTLIILMFAAVISIVLGMVTTGVGHGWVEGVAIFFAIFSVSMVTSVNNYQKEKQFRNLDAEKNNRRIKVLRDGSVAEISIFDILVGDVVQLESGDSIPADGVFIDGFDLAADESALTGEPEQVDKCPDEPFLLSGCQVAEGTGRMLVLAVGSLSEWGLIQASLVNTEREETDLQKKLGDMAETIGKIGLLFATLTFAALFIRWIVRVSHDYEHDDLNDLVEFVVIAITIVVVAVPEGLPLAVTISLAYSMKKMMRDNNLVRHLDACETMGNATQICSDKTGTLTQNRMTVVRGWIAGKSYHHVPAPGELQAGVKSLLCQGIAINSKAHVSIVAAKDNKPEATNFIGSKTECALLVLASRLGADYKTDRNRLTARIVHLYAFSSDKKYMGVVVTTQSNDPLAADRLPYRFYVKGASEIVLQLCTRMVTADGGVTDMGNTVRQQLMREITEMASQGLRTICLAYRDMDKSFEGTWEKEPSDHLTCIAVVGIQDPVRAEVPAAVATCQSAGITVRMVTGDNILTAKSIAAICGILKDGGLAMEGTEFRALTNEQLDPLLPRLQVLARSSPTDKERLVSRLKELGEVVAVTGDGTNDGPALRKADVGFSMGIAGTEVAKEASDIVIMDDNFSSIVRAVLWGRSVYDNIKKFLQFQLTINMVALCLAVIAAIGGKGIPLKAVQLLWVNLIMDTMAALALGTEKPHDSLLLRKPYGRTEPLISFIMIRNICGQGLYQLIALLVILYGGRPLFGLSGSDDDVQILYTIVFNTFVFCQIFNEINSRKINDEMNVFAGLFSNAYFVSIMVGTMIVQAVLVEFGGSFVKTTGLNGSQWATCILIGAGCIPYGFLLRLVPVPAPKRNSVGPGITPVATVISGVTPKPIKQDSGTLIAPSVSAFDLNNTTANAVKSKPFLLESQNTSPIANHQSSAAVNHGPANNVQTEDEVTSLPVTSTTRTHHNVGNNGKYGRNGIDGDDNKTANMRQDTARTNASAESWGQTELDSLGSVQSLGRSPSGNIINAGDSTPKRKAHTLAPLPPVTVGRRPSHDAASPTSTPTAALLEPSNPQ